MIHYNRAEKIFIKDSLNHIIELSKLYNNIGILHVQQTDLKKAEIYFKRSLQLRKKNNHKILENTLYYLGYIAWKSGRYEKAHDYYFSAIKNRINRHGEKYHRLAPVYMSYGAFLQEQKKPDSALLYLQKAKKIAIENFGTRHPLTAESYLYLGDYQRKQQNFKTALNYYQKAVLSISPDFSDTCIYRNPKLDKKTLPDRLLIRAVRKKAETFRQIAGKNKGSKAESLKYLKASHNSYTRTVSFLELLKTRMFFTESKMLISENAESIYAGCIQTAMQLYQLTNENVFKHTAFEYAEKSKYATLAGARNEDLSIRYAGIPDELTALEKQLKKKIGIYKSALSGHRTNNKQHEEVASGRLIDLVDSLENLVRYFEKNYPKYYKLKYNPGTVSCLELQKKFETDEILCEYALTDSIL